MYAQWCGSEGDRGGDEDSDAEADAYASRDTVPRTSGGRKWPSPVLLLAEVVIQDRNQAILIWECPWAIMRSKLKIACPFE